MEKGGLYGGMCGWGEREVEKGGCMGGQVFAYVAGASEVSPGHTKKDLPKGHGAAAGRLRGGS